MVDNKTLAALRAMPRQDNAGYHEAVRTARQAYTDAEAFFAGEPFTVTSEVSSVDAEAITVTYTFKRIS